MPETLQGFRNLGVRPSIGLPLQASSLQVDEQLALLASCAHEQADRTFSRSFLFGSAVAVFIARMFLPRIPYILLGYLVENPNRTAPGRSGCCSRSADRG